MKKEFKFYIINLAILIFIIMFKILTNIIEYNHAYLINIIFWFLLAIILYIIGGFPRDKNYYKKTSIKIVLITILIYILLVYLLGFFLGFVKNLYFYNFIMLIKKTLPIALFIIGSEVTRYLYFKHNPSKLQIIIFTLELIILNIIIGINDYSLASGKHLFIAFSIIVLPTIASEAMYSYVTYNVGLIPSLIYKLFFNLYIYLAPFVPNFNDYLNAVLGVFVPYIIYNEIKKNLKDHEKYHKYAKKTVKKAIGIIILSFLVIIILLVSGIFKYQLIAIATGSMEPIYYRGDGVIIEKKDPEKINIGDILVYKTSGGVITHRVIKIENNNNNLIFYTKGDNNETADSQGAEEDKVIGIVRYIVKYVGYPTIILNDILESK